MAFLKPNLWNLLLTPVFFWLTSSVWSFLKGMFVMDASFFGFPLNYFTAWGPCQVGADCSETNNLNFFLDIVIWYVASAVLVFLVKKYGNLLRRKEG